MNDSDWVELKADDTLMKGDRVLYLPYPLASTTFDGIVTALAANDRVVISKLGLYHTVPQAQVTHRYNPRPPREQTRTPGPAPAATIIIAFALFLILVLTLWRLPW